MGGFLVFAKEFRVPEGVEAPLPEHLRTFENLVRSDPVWFIRVDEFTCDVTYREIDQLKSYGETVGIPRDCWPDFIDREGDARLIPVEKIVEKNALLKEALSALSPEAVAGNENLAIVRRELAAGRMLFIDN